MTNLKSKTYIFIVYVSSKTIKHMKKSGGGGAIAWWNVVERIRCRQRSPFSLKKTTKEIWYRYTYNKMFCDEFGAVWSHLFSRRDLRHVVTQSEHVPKEGFSKETRTDRCHVQRGMLPGMWTCTPRHRKKLQAPSTMKKNWLPLIIMKQSPFRENKIYEHILIFRF